MVSARAGSPGRDALGWCRRPQAKGANVLIHLVADYGFGDLAFAEVRQRLALYLPEADVAHIPVPAFDTLGGGFCVGQLALTEGPADRVVYSNVAPRADEEGSRAGNEGEQLVAARLPSGVLVVGPNSTYAFSFVRDEATEIREVVVPESSSQFRSRDVFPALVAALARGEREPLGPEVPVERIPDVPGRCVVYVDGYGNLKTSWTEPPAPVGSRVRVRIGPAQGMAVVSDGTFAVPEGETSFAPGSSGWRTRAGRERRFYELFARGGSAAELFGQPTAGAAIEVVGV